MLTTEKTTERLEAEVKALSADNEAKQARINCLQGMHDRVRVKLEALKAIYAEAIPGKDVELQELLGRSTREIDRLQRANAELRSCVMALQDKRTTFVSSTTEILTACAKAYGHTFDEVISQKRMQSITRARQLAWNLMRDILPQLSLTEAAHLTGHKDHTTVRHGILRIDELMKTDASLRRQRDVLFTRLAVQE